MRVWKSAGLLTLAMAGGLSGGTNKLAAKEAGEFVRQPPAAQLAVIEVTRSPRPVLRPQNRQSGADQTGTAVTKDNFEDWLDGFKQRAEKLGISEAILKSALNNVSYDPDVVRRDRNQSEFTKTIWDYLDSAASDARIKNGKVALNKNRHLLETIEAKFGVDKEVVVAIWGLESAYGTYRGSTDTIQALATLAFDARRSTFFEGQLLAALQILQSGDTTVRNMTGSWAGAMGHTQFMPTSYLDYAVDFTGDGKRDIWSDDPSDALASTAAYLAGFGWTKGQPWGLEVALPTPFDYRLADRKIQKTPDEWRRLGIKAVTGETVPNHGPASILLPAGADGAAFMVFDNFAVLENYNTADAYVIGVGHLADRIGGGPGFQAQWPRGDRALTLGERIEMQERLTAKGFDTHGIDGKIGPLTIDAVRAYQVASDMTPDGYASLHLLKTLR